MYYLYVKQHNKTGLKYLGKTEQDPYKYQGSGYRWIPHLKKHGNDVTTEIIGTYDSLDNLREAGLYYSKLWNVVESDEWANLIEETGSGGPYYPTEEQRKHHSEVLKGRKHSDEHKKKIGLAVLGQKRSEEQRKNISLALLGHKGWNKGQKLSEITKQKMRKPKTPEHTESIRQAQLIRTKHPMSGHKHSEQTKQIMTEKAKICWEKRKAKCLSA